MRKLITVSVGLIIIISIGVIFMNYFGETGIDSSKLVERGGLSYEANSKVPFTGLSTSKYKSGGILEKIYFKNGIKDGLWTTYYSNGQLVSKVLMKNGFKEGLQETYYQNGILGSKTHFKNGIKEEFKKYFLVMVDCRVKYISKTVTKKGARKNITKILNFNQKVLLKTVSGMENLCSFGIMGRYPKKEFIRMEGELDYGNFIIVMGWKLPKKSQLPRQISEAWVPVKTRKNI